VKTARAVRVESTQFNRESGRVRFRYSVDNYAHIVHAIYHDPPHLSSQVWSACIGELALACAVDIATSALSKTIVSKVYNPGLEGWKVLRAASDALRLEVLQAERLGLDRLHFASSSDGLLPTKSHKLSTNPRNVMLLMGGGKDSLYCYRVLKDAGYHVHCFYLTEATRSWQRLKRVWNALDGEVPQFRAFLDVNRRGAIDARFDSAYVSQYQIGQVVAASLPYALATGCRYIALGLERSSDDPMSTYCGRKVNHQHQKSAPFVRLLNRHLLRLFEGSLQIVSPLHSFYDTAIYARFLALDRSFVRLQSSCGGANWRTPHCGRCTKCGFLAALLAALSGDRKLYRFLFPKDPLNELEAYGPWLEASKERPLTCAGHKGEFLAALSLARVRGWQNAAIDEMRMIPNRKQLKASLDEYLAIHSSPMVPSSMSGKLRSHFLAHGREAVNRISAFL
jgi:7-cyano-7-deazaguanine synthase in queuosine biosynthesis